MARDYERNPALFQGLADFSLILRWKRVDFHPHLALDNSLKTGNAG
jgi:hypothetical protein